MDVVLLERHLSFVGWTKHVQASLSFFEDDGEIHERKPHFSI